ncbi:DUF3109 family protein [Aneurinibacillus sp. Ricciae_BoGa-3]|uniref:DUF3109 family protein n=1 Tax=Aneurinibacillus sp. Ricciae_BoGa-3 TaxID=3022697 RepID=UPI002341D4B2|nr:DUF3109 family protein [Aneurinibacillus sp. Ricciae_BoGa-3]WCK55625.1 DUF3109 family protein [Aneurinibacillus sp. Ricciae_BoGa-3]
MTSFYYGTPEPLHWEDEILFIHYLKDRVGKTIHSYEHYLIDEALLTPVNLDCFNCHLVHGQNCCEGGQPYSMEGTNLEEFRKHAFAILERHTSTDRIRLARQKGLFEKSAATNFYPSIRAHEGDCLFLIKDNGQHVCAIHRYALENKLDPGRIKPFSCSLFPLELIEYDGKILVTALTPETDSFSRWGDFYLDRYSCVNHKNRPSTAADSHFAKEGYTPAWEWSKGLLRSYWGEETVQEMEKVLYSKLPH